MTNKRQINVFLGFDFYGAGNIGDDLMVAGFLSGFASDDRFTLTCCLPRDRLGSQRGRFPQIRWLEASGKDRHRLIAESDVWLGVGGTPFQATGGSWLLKSILADFDACPETPKFMVGVGCEIEVQAERARAARVLEHVNRIWTRDQGSYNVLVEQLGNMRPNVTKGSDLANIALQKIFVDAPNTTSHSEGVGLIIYKDVKVAFDKGKLRRNIRELMSKQPVTLIANDIRRGVMEHAVFKQAFGGLRGLLRPKPRWMAPDYNTQCTDDMVQHFYNYSTVLSARYHGLLTAAWADCAVTALARSSKLTFLAEDLGIATVPMEYSSDFINEGLAKASIVPKNILNERARIARENLEDLKSHLLEFDGHARDRSNRHD